MFHGESSRPRPGEGAAQPLALVAVRWGAYALMLTAGLALLQVAPAHDVPSVPPASHVHVAQTGRGAATVSWVPTLREEANPELAPTEVAAHQHANLAHHKMRTIRLSPHQLSLAKW